MNWPCHTRLVNSVIMLTGKAGYNNIHQLENSGGSSKHSRNKGHSQTSQEYSSGSSDSQFNGKRESNSYYDNYLWFGPKGIDGVYLQWVSSSYISFQSNCLKLS